MWHVDDGHLHAYLDGELESTDPGGVRRLEDHLASCAECAARLVAARRVRERAGELLASSDPHHIDAPPFEQIAARRRRRAATPRAAWAATVVLALGAGWLARGLLDPAPDTAMRMEAGDARDARIARDALADEQQAATPGSQPSRESAPPPLNRTPRNEAASGAAASAPAPAAPPPSAPAPEIGAQQLSDAHSGAANVEATGALAGAAAPPPPPAPSSAPTTSPAPVTTEERRQRALVPRDALSSKAAELPPVFPGAVWTRVSLEEARRLLQGDVLTLQQLAATYDAALVDGALVVRARQRLQGGETLEIVHELATADKGMDEAAASARDAVVFTRDGKRITLRAPISPDSLRILAARVR